MRLEFTKMHGLGNDFVVIDGITQAVSPDPARIRFIADRHFGVGCDQVLLVERPTVAGADFRYRIFNADGGEVEQCGNGARCFARFVRDRGLTDATVIPVETAAGRITLTVEADGQVTVDMGRPRLEPEAIPFVAEALAVRYPIDVDGQALHIGALSMGNPHAVLTVEAVDRAPVQALGPRLERHARFPRRVNVGFMEIVGRGHIRLRVFERGVGETLACGSGACAAVVAGRLQGVLDASVRVDLPGGALHIRWPGEGASVLMTGPADRVFEGWIEW
ncbi:MAG: diaminopimelate epimerase [Pseudomonadota bacterium]|nr:diaminopimelate epimerase [Pseudomonadota bacterium]